MKDASSLNVTVASMPLRTKEIKKETAGLKIKGIES